MGALMCFGRLQKTVKGLEGSEKILKTLVELGGEALDCFKRLWLAIVRLPKTFCVLWWDSEGFWKIVRGFRGLLEPSVGFFKASEDGFCRL